MDQIDLKAFNLKRMGVVVGTLFSSEFSDDLRNEVRLPELREKIAGILIQHGLPANQIEAGERHK